MRRACSFHRPPRADLVAPPACTFRHLVSMCVPHSTEPATVRVLTSSTDMWLNVTQMHPQPMHPCDPARSQICRPALWPALCMSSSPHLQTICFQKAQAGVASPSFPRSWSSPHASPVAPSTLSRPSWGCCCVSPRQGRRVSASSARSACTRCTRCSMQRYAMAHGLLLRYATARYILEIAFWGHGPQWEWASFPQWGFAPSDLRRAGLRRA